MTGSSDAALLEAAIRQYILWAPDVRDAIEGELHIKVDLEPDPHHEGELLGILFLSTRWPVTDPTWLTNLMAHVREGFKRGLIEAPFHVTVEPDQSFDATSEAGVGTLLSVPAYLTVRRDADAVV